NRKQIWRKLPVKLSDGRYEIDHRDAIANVLICTQVYDGKFGKANGSGICISTKTQMGNGANYFETTIRAARYGDCGIGERLACGYRRGQDPCADSDAVNAGYFSLVSTYCHMGTGIGDGLFYKQNLCCIGRHAKSIFNLQ